MKWARAVALAVALTVLGCGLLKPALRTANDIARELCMTTAASQTAEALGNLAVEVYCDHNTQLFLDEVLAAQARAASAAGFARPQAPPDAGQD